MIVINRQLQGESMDIVLIRHGESEANLINQKTQNTGDSQLFCWEN